MEWNEEFKETDIRHRHVSHLYMLYPGNEIDPLKTPELAKAARKSLDVRTDVGTGWSLAWKVNFWARLRDGDRAYQLLKNLLGLSQLRLRRLPSVWDCYCTFRNKATAHVDEMNGMKGR